MTVSPGDSPLRHAWFAEFHFKSSTARVWTGYRNISLNGHTWSPVGPNGAVDTIEDPIAGSAPALDIRMSGVDSAALATALAGTDEIRGQLVFIYDQYFDAAWQPTGSFAPYAMVRMDTVKVSRSENADGSWDRMITIPSEYLLTAGPNPPSGRYSNADQFQRHPGVTDHYFEFMGQNQNKRIRWPTF